VKNPWDRACVPGGSSGGSAAAVAARMAPAATGRHRRLDPPAGSAVGAIGLEADVRLVSRYGMIAFRSSLDPGRPDREKAPKTSRCFSRHGRVSMRAIRPRWNALAKTTLGTSRTARGSAHRRAEEHFGEGLAADVGKAVEGASRSSKSSAQNAFRSPALERPVGPAYYVIARQKLLRTCRATNGVRYGHRAKAYSDLADMYRKTRAEGFGAEVRRRILNRHLRALARLLRCLLPQGTEDPAADANDFAEAFKLCDLVVGPTTPTVAFR